MIRRIVSPLGACVLFLILSALVLCGLSWVTVASLQVEAAQREASRTADWATKERLALWRMDGFVLPAYGVETNRPFAHYSALHTAYLAVDADFNQTPANSNWLRLPSPLLSVDLPPWMALHFQVDPETGWESPQVIPQELYDRLTNGPQWLDCQNVTPQRQMLLHRLKQQFDKETILSLFAQSERNTTDDDLFLLPAPMPADPSTPKPGAEAPAGELKWGGPPSDSNLRRAEMRSIRNQTRTGEPDSQPGLARQMLPDAKMILDRAMLSARQEAKLASDHQAENFQQLQKPGGFGGAGAAVPGGLGSLQNTMNMNQNSQFPTNPAAARGANPLSNTLQNLNTKGDPAYDKRDEVAKTISRSNVENVPSAVVAGPPPDKANPAASMRPAPTMPTHCPMPLAANLPSPASSPAVTPNAEKSPPGRGPEDLPSVAPMAPSAAPLSKPSNADTKKTETAPKTDHPAAPNVAASKSVKETATQDARQRANSEPQANTNLALRKEKDDFFNQPAKPAADAASLPAGADQARQQLESATPSSSLLAGFASIAGDRKAAAGSQPMAVHVGPLRSQWLIAPDGTSYLVFIRAARLESKTIFQGIVLDWLQVQERLGDLVADLFPSASFKPIFPGDTPNPERAMSILPVQLDPGPMPELPSVGWTPLRFGLLLAWLAAIIALLAVGFGGRALLDLSERRIRFVSAVTHELRTPLTSLRLYLDLLTSGMIEDPAKQKEYLTTLAQESERLNRLIENVLDFARLEKRGVQAQCHPVDVEELIDQVRQTWADRCAAEGRELVIVSTVSHGQRVLTDTRMTLQILGNLIDNSRKYSRDSAEPRIWLWIKPGEQGKVAFEVEDRGPGVPASERGTIFRPFRRGHEADTVAGGAGLGLALAKQWADMLGGTLSYRTPEGGIGACFRLELPGQPTTPPTTKPTTPS